MCSPNSTLSIQHKYIALRMDENGNVIWRQSYVVPFNGFESTIIKETSYQTKKALLKNLLEVKVLTLIRQ
ncbi:MAG: hypothetical protein ACJA1N_002176 [Saprospiraceae bacterium]|jgi:hypothetical protein